MVAPPSLSEAGPEDHVSLYFFARGLMRAVTQAEQQAGVSGSGRDRADQPRAERCWVPALCPAHRQAVSVTCSTRNPARTDHVRQAVPAAQLADGERAARGTGDDQEAHPVRFPLAAPTLSASTACPYWYQKDCFGFHGISLAGVFRTWPSTKQLPRQPSNRLRLFWCNSELSFAALVSTPTGRSLPISGE
jgi:hypothetical protein